MPDFRKSQDYTIHDPACGTGGFLIGAFEWIMKETHNGAKLTVKDRERLVKKTFSGMDNVIDTRRLALMNCYLHELEATIFYGDSIDYGHHVGKRYDIILTNPPFGTKGANQAPSRDDFLISTSNKQLNFVQHCITILKQGGEAAMVVPDNVLFDRSGRGVREHLIKVCNLHTILRLPEGVFNPYSTGVKTNVIFFRKGYSTKEVWIYDLRTNIKNINKGNRLTEELFKDFEEQYNHKPRKENERFKRFTKDDIEAKDYNLDIFWLKDESINEEILDPYSISKQIEINLQNALHSISYITKNLRNNE